MDWWFHVVAALLLLLLWYIFVVANAFVGRVWIYTQKKNCFGVYFFYSVCFYLFSYNPIRMALWNNVTNFAARLYLCVWEMVRTHRAIFTFTCQRHTLLLTDLGFAIKNHAKNRAHCFIHFSVFIRWCTRKRDACALFQLAKWAFSKGFFLCEFGLYYFFVNWIQYHFWFWNEMHFLNSIERYTRIINNRCCALFLLLF